MHSVSSDGVNISCRVAGSRDCRADCLLIHGMNANMAFWHPGLVRSLGQHRRIAMFDLRGHGRSDLPPTGYTSTDLAKDAEAVLEHVGMDSCVDIVAHSFGATVALQLARRSPSRVRSLTLLDGRIRQLQMDLRLKDWIHFPQWQSRFSETGFHLDPELKIDFRLPLTIPRAAWDAARKELAADGFFAPSNSERSMRKYRLLMTETSAEEDLDNPCGLTTESITQIDNACLAVYGERSPYLETNKKLQDLLPNISSHLIERGGHNFPLFAPVETARHIVCFWDSLPTGKER